MFHKFLFGTMSEEPSKFFKTRPKAQQMYDRAMAYPYPIRIVPLATRNWKVEKASTQQHVIIDLLPSKGGVVV